MEKSSFMIENIPAVLWGEKSDKLLLAIHGNGSNKTDVVIEIVATVAVEKGYQVLSFDLPEHGDRKDEARLCDAQNGVEDLSQVMDYARTISDNISVFGCSIGAYFSLLAYQGEAIQKALFLSPIVDMKRLIANMMQWFEISEARLEEEQEIATPISTLYWHYYQYVMQHPIQWDKPTSILYGEKDGLVEYDVIEAFAEKWKAKLTVLADSEHFFCTDTQLDFLKKWLRENLEA